MEKNSSTTDLEEASFILDSVLMIFDMENRNYRTAIHMFEVSYGIVLSYYKEGLITKEELDKTKTRLAKKYGLKNKSVFLDK